MVLRPTWIHFFSKSFVTNHSSKPVSKLWEEIEGALLTGIEKLIPKKTLGSKPSLPWMTQDIRRHIRKRDSLFDKYKKHRRPKDRQEFLTKKHHVSHQIKQAHNSYLDGIIGLCDATDLDDTTRSPDKTYVNKKLFSFLKNAK